MVTVLCLGTPGIIEPIQTRHVRPWISCPGTSSANRKVVASRGRVPSSLGSRERGPYGSEPPEASPASWVLEN